jgi:hypothetical protein
MTAERCQWLARCTGDAVAVRYDRRPWSDQYTGPWKVCAEHRDPMHGTPGKPAEKIAPCDAVYVTNTLGGMDVCARPVGHDGRHDWRAPIA